MRGQTPDTCSATVQTPPTWCRDLTSNLTLSSGQWASANRSTSWIAPTTRM